MTHDEAQPPGCSRRTVLALGAVGGAVVVGTSLGWPTTAAATVGDTVGDTVVDPDRWTRNTTQNGWRVVGADQVTTFRIQGSGATTALRPGPAAVILLHVARRWHYDIAELTPGDVLGHTGERRIAAALESNHLSGTAIAIHPGAYPLGATDTLYDPQLLVVRDLLAECEGVVRWGGDDANTPKEGHFQIDVRPNDPALLRVAAKITDWDLTVGRGAGTPVELISSRRLTAARELQLSQIV